LENDPTQKQFRETGDTLTFREHGYLFHAFAIGMSLSHCSQLSVGALLSNGLCLLPSFSFSTCLVLVVVALFIGLNLVW